MVHQSPGFDELRDIGRKCITRHHVHHYKGFANTQWNLFAKESPPRVKPLLYVYRVLLTGMHLMATGEVEANLGTLNQQFHLPYVSDLIALKTGTAEQATLNVKAVQFHAEEFQRLMLLLEYAGQESKLRDEPEAQKDLNDLLIRLRLGQTPG